jgi:zinc-binding alcohol dehydrogenase family protein
MKSIDYLVYEAIKKDGVVSYQKAQRHIEYSDVRGYDVLVKIEAISVNPIDIKLSSSLEEGESKVVGYDASGVVVKCGEKVGKFKEGDEVYYAGDKTREGSYASNQLVDSRIVAKKPEILSFLKSASLPLTSLASFEALRDRLNISSNPRLNSGKRILIIGASGGVGSIAIQLAKLFGLTVYGTYGKEESKRWIEELGVDLAVDHHQDIVRQINGEVDYILNLNSVERYRNTMERLIKPEGKICALVSNVEEVDLKVIKEKSVTFAWEFMFTRNEFKTEDMARQGRILAYIAKAIDEGKLKCTLNKSYEGLNEDNLQKMKEDILSGKNVGKVGLKL